MEPRRPFSSLHKDYVVTSLRCEMVSLMDTLENYDQYEVEYI